MPPILDSDVLETEKFWIAVVGSVIAVTTLVLAALLCGCGGDKKKDGAKGKEEKPAYLDLPADLDKAAPEEKKASAPPPSKTVDGANPAYQTLINNSKFEATATAAGLSPPPMLPTPKSNSGPGKSIEKPSGKSFVSGANPAYQTLLNDSKFEASKVSGKSNK